MKYYYSLFFALMLLDIAPLVAQCPVTVSAGEDIYLCAPTSPTQLDGSIDGDYLNFFWSPTTGMSGSNTLTPTVSVNTTTNYVLTVRAADLSNNLIDNGDFGGGNSGFTSDYIYSPGDLVPEGVYDVLDNPQDDHPSFAPCDDHTSGDGNMMVVNGAGVPNQNVWCQTVPVTPNTQYVFSAWVTSVVAASPALLQFSINGTPLGNIFSAPGGTCNWANFFQTWSSGSNGSATICIVNQNTTLGGNDFALDDLVFAPTCLVKDTVTVHVINITAAASPAVSFIPCDGANLTLSGAGSSTGANITYSWDTPDGNIVSGGNTLSPVVNAAGTYTISVIFDNGFVTCTKTATVTVAESTNPLAAWITPPAPIGCGSSTVTLIGNTNQGAFASYQWSTTNGNIVSGQNSKNAVVNQAGSYTLLVTNTNTGCTATAEVTVGTATNPPVANANAIGTINCLVTTTGLSGAGSTTGANISYAWTTPDGTILSGQNAQNAVAGAGGTYIIGVTNNSNNCTSYDTVMVTADNAAPTLSIQAPGILDCDTDTLTISATAAPTGVTAAWTASGGGSFASGQNTLHPKVLSIGTYTVTVTNPANGCKSTGSVTVSANYTQPIAAVQPANDLTCQQSSTTLSGSGSSTGPKFTYNWTASAGGNIVTGQNTLSPVVNAAGTYTLLVTDTTNACTATASVPVSADTNIVVAIANAPDTMTCVVDTVVLNTNGSSSGASMTYLWTTVNGNFTGATNIPNPVVNAPGTYQLLLTNTANGCSATDLAVVIQNLAAPNVQVALPDTLTCANPTQVIHSQNHSLPGSFTYNWLASNGGNILSGQDSLNPVVNAAGTYILTSTNLANSCISKDTVSVVIEAGTPVAIAAAPGPLTCVQPTLVLSTTGSSNGANFTYSWTTANGNIVGDTTSTTPTVNQPGSYNLLITNTQNGCTATDTVAVLENKISPLADAGPEGLLTCFQPVFILSGNNGSPTGNLEFKWSTPDGNFTGPQDTANTECDEAGIYILEVTDPANGCSTTDTVKVDANQQQPVLDIAAPGTLNCIQSTVTLTASASGNSLTYAWQTVDGQFVSGQNGPAPIVDASGTYSLLVTDAVNGCTVTSDVIVVQDTAAPIATIDPPYTLTCNFTQYKLGGSGTGNASWTTTGGNIVSGQNQFMPLIDAPGFYTLNTVDPANGCTATASVTVLEDVVSPLAQAGADDTLSCAVNTLTINSSGSGSAFLTFTWTASNGGNIVSGADSLNPVVDAAGTYTLLIVNTGNGCTASDVVQIFEDVNTPQANAGAPATLTCAVQQTNLNASASTGSNITYLWAASNGGNILSGQNTLNPLVNEPGDYSLTVTNLSNGCVATSQVTVGENVAPPPVGVTPSGLLTCAVTSLTLSGMPVTGNYIWNWTTGNGNIISGANSPNPVIDAPGAYSLFVTDQQNGCSATALAIVSEDVVDPVIAIAAPATLTCAVTNLPLTGSVSQPTVGFTAGWTTSGGHFVLGQNSLSPIVDAPGVYTLTVQNTQNGCSATAQTTVAQNITPPLAKAAAPDAISCADPTVSLDGTGSSAGTSFTYNWSGGQIVSGQTTLNPVVAAAGSYILTVTDGANGCIAIAVVVVPENTAAPAVAIPLPELLTCIQKEVTLTGNLPGSLPDFTADWTTTNGHFISGQNSLFPIVDQPGAYSLTVVNLENGCSTTMQTTVVQNITPPGADAGPSSELHCNQPQLTLQGSSPTTGNMTYAWTTTGGNFINGATTAKPLVDAPGNYSLTVTSPVNGCTSADVVAVTEVPPPAFQPELIQPDCNDPKGAVDMGAITGGKAPYSYSKDGGQSFSSQSLFNNLSPGPYLLVVRDAYGCTAESDIEVEEPFVPTVTLPTYIDVELGDVIYLEPLLNQPVSNIAVWQWSPADGLSCTDCRTPIAKPLRTTLYHLKITDLNGCDAAAKVILRVDRRRILYAPNIFSPDGDGENDIFTIYGKSVTEIRSLQIFDRWGAELFIVEHLQANDETRGWDGRFRGKELNPAVFVWQAVVEFEDGEVEVFSGDVTIER
ncbi:MAG TPA: gliding motility-associated C-terminal domain-containing protein [Saprospiraceae bacterium]|nr:gliding motility-associated C-terminal domain-containing protein [Saprospiraceae bacterium]